MKKVDSNNGVWVNDDPTTLTNGTPIDADFMNNIQDEISNVITDNGETLDGTNHSQLSQTLDKTFAKLNSPTLIGVPLTSNPDGTINNQIATVDYVNQKALQATVGFVPTQQGGGTDQGANKVYIGGDSTDATQVRIQVDQTDLGKIAFQAEDNNTYGVSKIGYDHVKGELAYYDTGNKAWHYSYTTDYIDGKAYISSIPTGDNSKVTDIIWNTSSNLPAYYYGINNQVSYSATTDWVNGNFATQTLLNNETNARTAADKYLQNQKANLAGGNQLSGDQDISLGGLRLVGNTSLGAASYQLAIQRGDAWRYAIDYAHDDNNGNYSRWIFYDGDTNVVKDILYYFLDKGRLSSANHGDYTLMKDFSASLGTNGYQKLASGLIMQWGSITSSNGTFNFPITFPSTCFNVLVGNTTSQGNTVDNAYAYPINQSQFFAATKQSQANALSGFPITWIALGY